MNPNLSILVVDDDHNSVKRWKKKWLPMAPLLLEP